MKEFFNKWFFDSTVYVDGCEYVLFEHLPHDRAWRGARVVDGALSSDYRLFRYRELDYLRVVPFR